MLSATLHRADVKALIQRRYGSVKGFAETKGFSYQGIADVLRGRKSRKIHDAIAAEFGLEGHDLSITSESIKLDDSAPQTTSHRRNARGQ